MEYLAKQTMFFLVKHYPRYAISASEIRRYECLSLAKSTLTAQASSPLSSCLLR